MSVDFLISLIQPEKVPARARGRAERDEGLKGDAAERVMGHRLPRDAGEVGGGVRLDCGAARAKSRLLAATLLAMTVIGENDKAPANSC
jgi:hypothetical protein